MLHNIFKKVKAPASILLVVFLISGCITTKENIGGLMGAGAGGFAGSYIGGGKGKTAATIIGTILGYQVGSSIGKSLDYVDKMKANQAAQYAVNYTKNGQSTPWNNPNTGNSGAVMPTSTYYQGDGQPCREYQTSVTIGGRAEQAYGTACRQNDGSWLIR